MRFVLRPFCGSSASRLSHKDFEHFPTVWVFHGRRFAAVDATRVLVLVETDGGAAGAAGSLHPGRLGNFSLDLKFVCTHCSIYGKFPKNVMDYTATALLVQ